VYFRVSSLGSPRLRSYPGHPSPGSRLECWNCTLDCTSPRDSTLHDELNFLSPLAAILVQAQAVPLRPRLANGRGLQAEQVGAADPRRAGQASPARDASGALHQKVRPQPGGHVPGTAEEGADSDEEEPVPVHLPDCAGMVFSVIRQEPASITKVIRDDSQPSGMLETSSRKVWPRPGGHIPGTAERDVWSKGPNNWGSNRVALTSRGSGSLFLISRTRLTPRGF
jgi:hypothetical protein